jgi:Domain of unknown function (DUF4402)
MGRTMAKLRSILMAMLACWLLPVGPAWASAAQDDETPLQVEIRTQLDFSRAASAGSGSGQISIDPESGSRQVVGDVVDLGGSALAGSAVVTGQPGRAVRIDMPLRIRLSGSAGGSIEISNLRTNLRPGARLDSFGRLEFSFGGDLHISGSVAGTFRGRIPITAEYE